MVTFASVLTELELKLQDETSTEVSFAIYIE